MPKLRLLPRNTPVGLVAAGLGVSILYSSLVARLTIADVLRGLIGPPYREA